MRRSRAIRSGNLAAVATLYDGPVEVVRKRVNEQWAKTFRTYRRLEYEREARLVGLCGNRALVREWHRLSGEVKARQRLELGEGVTDRALVRETSGWRLDIRGWRQPDLIRDILDRMDRAENWDEVGVLHLVAELRGGTWRPDRYTWWAGAVRGRPMNEATPEALRAELVERLRAVTQEQHDAGRPGWVHLFLQKNGEAWRTAGGTWYETVEDDTSWAASEEQVRDLRAQAEAAFGDPQAHVRLGEGLANLGLHAEAYDEFLKAEALEPGSLGEGTLATARARVREDPLARAYREARFETELGVGDDHPLLTIRRLQTQARQNPRSPELAAALGVELSRVAEDREAARQLRLAQSLAAGRPHSQALSLTLQLLDRQVRTAVLKPPAAVRSKLFTLRFSSGDEAVFRVMGALERARHVIYSEFRMPLGGTEVLLFPNRESFQTYSLAVLGRQTEEVTAAFTVGEQIVTYSQLDTDNLSMVAHELGHVAARRLTRHNPVAPWFDEGLACCVQGGYWGYRDRVRQARADNRLLSFSALRRWQLEHDSSLLAYSQVNDMLDFFRRTYGRSAVHAVLQTVGTGATFDTAFRQVTHRTPEQFYQLWLEGAAT